eukprot:UN32289
MVLVVIITFQLLTEYTSEFYIPQFSISENYLLRRRSESDGKKRQVFIVQSDTRPLNKNSLEYYNLGVLSYYAFAQNYTLIRYDTSKFCWGRKQCYGYDGIIVHPCWTKIVALMFTFRFAKDNDFIIFLDSDATTDITALTLPVEQAAPSIYHFLYNTSKSINR